MHGLGVADMQPIWTLFLALPLAALAEGTPDPEWADAHLPVIDCAVHIPERFDPSDPVVLIAYTNTSDRCPAYRPIPYLAEEFKSMSADVVFDRVPPPPLEDGPEPVSANTRLEIPPGCVVSVPYRMADSTPIPTKWERMRVVAATGDSTNNPWFEFSRSGDLLTSAVGRVRSYDEMVARAWSSSDIRWYIRAGIQRYAEMKAKGEPMLPRIGTAGSPTKGVTGPLPGVEIVDGVVRYAHPRPTAFPDASTAVAVPPARSAVPLAVALGLLSAGALAWALLRRQRPDA